MKLLKKHKLKTTNKPARNNLLSGVVHVGTKEGKGYAYVSFSDEFVDDVGYAMPRGVSEREPAYLKVLHMHASDMWRVMAVYCDKEEGVTLWEDKSRPGWLGKIYPPKV